MEYVIVAQVDGDVPHALRAGKMITRGVGKKHEVAAFKVVEPDRRSLLHLRAGGDVEKHTRAFVIGVLCERRAVEFARHEIRIEYAVSPPLGNNTNSENGFVLFFAVDYFGIIVERK